MARPIPVELSTHPSRVTLVSPTTGQLTVYEQNKMINAVEVGNTLDPASTVTKINDDYYAQGVDGWCSDVRMYRSDVADFCEVETYLPESTVTANGGSLIAPALIPVIIIIIKAAIVIGAVLIVASTIAQLIPSRPKLYAPNPTTGEYELMDRETAVSAIQIANPGSYVNPNTGAVFGQGVNQDFVDWYNSTLPEDWMQTPTWDIGNIVTMAVIGVAGIAAIWIGAKYLGRKASGG